VEGHGGAIWCGPPEEPGAAIHFTLPAAAR
jgi:signal transduction histidine kinase